MSPDPNSNQAIRNGVVAALALAVSLGACAPVPDLGTRPALRTTETVEASETLQRQGAVQWPGDGWWNVFGDAQLNGLMDAALANSPDMALAAARVRRAEALAQRAGAAGLPSIGAGAEVGLRKQSANNGFPKQFLPDGWRDNAQLSLSFGYDLDLWGKNRAALAAATSEARAAAVDAAQARLFLTTGIAQAYSGLERLYRQRDLAVAGQENRKAARLLIDRRLTQGLENRAALRQADAEYSRSVEQVAAIDEDIALRRNQLAALIGAGPDRGSSIVRPIRATILTGGVPDGVSTDLIGRRPDIVASRERVEAASSRIAEARAGFFPSVNLAGLIGLQSLGIGNLLQADSIFGNAGPAISLPVFQGGALQGQFRTARADYDVAVASYNATVLSAYQEVADAVTRQDAAQKRLAVVQEALGAREEASEIVRRRYAGGLANYLDVLTAERGVQESRVAVAMVEADLLAAQLALVRALGGGFDGNVSRLAGITAQ